ncbi:[phosphatase 2A protein]-leucine-carboxy methyltransferase [Malassezia psittaci]|uniref:Leucine carboxyl methyltransferase 1 n=1 Tax=Malassezia psittaci TaxID=1821823 RepID=A0AAF0F7M1_9BASI|nr:[phosphatase 2A protein]-leucine-carboxy methyltransferase [Malassezia psittaci]
MERRTDGAASLRLGTPFRRQVRADQDHVSETGAIRSTDSDALLSRISAVQLGYLPFDPFATLFANGANTETKRPLLINIGTVLRSREMDARVETFLRSGSVQLSCKETNSCPVQIISLGAGSDTRFWRLAQDYPSCFRNLSRYVEVDYPQVVAQKCQRIQEEQTLLSSLGLEPVFNSNEVVAEKYALLAEDLLTYGQDEDTNNLARLLNLLDPSKPTLLIWECVLAYLDPITANRILTNFSRKIPNLAIICYDMCISGDQAEPGDQPDRFGQMMLHNLSARQLKLAGAKRYTTPTMALTPSNMSGTCWSHMSDLDCRESKDWTK